MEMIKNLTIYTLKDGAEFDAYVAVFNGKRVLWIPFENNELFMDGYVAAFFAMYPDLTVKRETVNDRTLFA